MGNRNVFGFEELEKSFKRMSKKYPEEKEALLVAASVKAVARLKEVSPVSKGHTLKNNKNYKGGNYKKGWRREKPVNENGAISARVKNEARHAHLVNYGHRMVTHKRLVRYAHRMVEHKGKAVGYVKGTKNLQSVADEMENQLAENVEKMLDELIREAQL